jgi:hypothetical protein
MDAAELEFLARAQLSQDALVYSRPQRADLAAMLRGPERVVALALASPGTRLGLLACTTDRILFFDRDLPRTLFSSLRRRTDGASREIAYADVVALWSIEEKDRRTVALVGCGGSADADFSILNSFFADPTTGAELVGEALALLPAEAAERSRNLQAALSGVKRLDAVTSRRRLAELARALSADESIERLQLGDLSVVAVTGRQLLWSGLARPFGRAATTSTEPLGAGEAVRELIAVEPALLFLTDRRVIYARRRGYLRRATRFTSIHYRVLGGVEIRDWRATWTGGSLRATPPGPEAESVKVKGGGSEILITSNLAEEPIRLVLLEKGHDERARAIADAIGRYRREDALRRHTERATRP